MEYICNYTFDSGKQQAVICCCFNMSPPSTSLRGSWCSSRYNICLSAGSACATLALWEQLGISGGLYWSVTCFWKCTECCLCRTWQQKYQRSAHTHLCQVTWLANVTSLTLKVLICCHLITSKPSFIPGQWWRNDCTTAQHHHLLCANWSEARRGVHC